MKSDRERIELSFRTAIGAALKRFREEMAEIDLTGEEVDPAAFSILIEKAGGVLGRETPGAAEIIIADQARWLTLWANIERGAAGRA